MRIAESARTRLAELERDNRNLLQELAGLRKKLKVQAGPGSDAWCSPPEVGDPLAQFFAGPVDVDPCSNARSIILARLALTHGGLVLPWVLPLPVDRTAYQNDPYSKSDEWTAKMIAELAAGHVREHVRLCMMSTSTHWWADQCRRTRRNPRILALKRLSFLDPFAKDPGKRRMGCRFEPALLYWGPRSARFTREFAHLTRWTTWGRT